MLEFFKRQLNKVLNTDNKRKIAQNSGWLIFDHILKVLYGLIIGVWVARYLGPEEFGKLNYIFAFFALLIPFASFGMSAVIPKLLVVNEDKKEKVLCSAFVLTLISRSCAAIVALILVFYAHNDEKILWVLTLFVGLSYVFKSPEVLDNWLLNKLESRFSLISNNITRAVSAILRIGLILGGFSLVYFGGVIAIEALVLAVVIFIVLYKTQQELDFKRFVFCRDLFFKILKEGWVYAFTGLLTAALMSIDKIMIKNIVGAAGVGLYAVADSITLSFLFFTHAVVGSSFPVLLKLGRDFEFEHYAVDLQKMFNYLVLLAYGIIFAVLISGNYLISALWGNEFAFSAKILSVLIFSLVFIFFRACISNWMIMKDLKVFFLFTLIGAVGLNIALNWLLINVFGVIGAAYATLISLFLIYGVVGLFFECVRDIYVMQLRALFLVDYIKAALRFVIK